MDHASIQPPINAPTDEVAFPVLSPEDLTRCEDFGEHTSFAPGQTLFAAGDHPLDCYVLLTGEAALVDISRDEHSGVYHYGAGHFTGDIDLLTGRPALLSCEVIKAVEAIRIPPHGIREMFVRAPELGERFWRAFQRRRELLPANRLRRLARVWSPGRRGDLDPRRIFLSQQRATPAGWIPPSRPTSSGCIVWLEPSTRRVFPVVAYGGKLLYQVPSLVQMADHLGLRRRLSQKTLRRHRAGQRACRRGCGGVRGFRRTVHAGAGQPRTRRTGWLQLEDREPIQVFLTAFRAVTWRSFPISRRLNSARSLPRPAPSRNSAARMTAFSGCGLPRVTRRRPKPSSSPPAFRTVCSTWRASTSCTAPACTTSATKVEAFALQELPGARRRRGQLGGAGRHVSLADGPRSEPRRARR